MQTVVSVNWILGLLAGMKFPEQGEAHDFVKKTLDVTEDIKSLAGADKNFLQEEQVQQFEAEYSKLREELLTQKEGESVELYHRKLQLANLMENARRVFLHFATTGKVELEALE